MRSDKLARATVMLQQVRTLAPLIDTLHPFNGKARTPAQVTSMGHLGERHHMNRLQPVVAFDRQHAMHVITRVEELYISA
jgi:hypothetical protein